eukprot:jgi/Tetstr1/430961/TSEL_020716.t1
MATNADLDNAEAARVEAEVRAQVLQDDNAFRGVHAGATERLHDNRLPSDAKGLNLVVIDVSDATHDASGSGEVFNEDGTMIRKKWGIPCYPSEEDAEVSHIVAPPYIERICYATFNYRAGYTTAKHIYAKETVIAAIREYTPSPSSQPHCDHPNLWVVLTVHLMMHMRHGNALDLAEAWQQSELRRYYQAGKCPPSNVTFKGKEEVCEVTPHSSSEAAVHTFGGKPIVWSVQRTKVVSLPLAGTAASPKLPGLFAGVPARQKKRAGGIIKNNNNAVKKAAHASAATQAVPGDNVDEGSSPEPPSKKAKHPAKPAAGGLAKGRRGAGARAGGGALGSRAGRRAAVAAAATREQHAGRRGGPSQNRIGSTGGAKATKAPPVHEPRPIPSRGWRRRKGPRFRGPRTVVGPAQAVGGGKSHKVFEGYDPDTHYVKNLNEEWWDGYKGHPVVIFNEFRGQIKFSELLDLVDKWPKTVKWRNRESVPFLAKEIRVASIKPPEHVFSRIVENEEEPWGQFQRKFTVINLRKRKSNVVDLLA